MLNYSSFCVSSATTGVFLDRPDVVIATSPQLLVGLSGWWLARCKRVPFVFEVRDLWPESLAAVGMGSEAILCFPSLIDEDCRISHSSLRPCGVVAPAFKEYLVRHWRGLEAKISWSRMESTQALFRTHSRQHCSQARTRRRKENSSSIPAAATPRTAAAPARSRPPPSSNRRRGRAPRNRGAGNSA